MRLYLAGPMTGIPAMNFPAFDAAAANLRERGYDIVSPAELDSPESRAAALAATDGDLSGYSAQTGETWGDLLARDVKLIADEGIEGVVVLPGWERSRGAQLEVFVGRLCGLPVFHYNERPGTLRRISGFMLDAEQTAPPSARSHFLETEVKDPLRFGAVRESDLREAVAMPTLSPESYRQAFNSLPSFGEVRVVDPKTGGEKGQKLAQVGALDPLALLEVGKVAGFGAGKYERFNFAKGYAWSLSFDALQRHLLQWAAGEECDEESGLSHLGHASWHCLALLTFVLRERGTDDRLHKTLEAVA